MPGGLIQIVAYGAQDIFLTSIPEITFFKFIYNRYTNFSFEFKDLSFNGEKNFDEDIYCNITKDGDLLNQTIIKLVLPSVYLKKDINYELLSKYEILKKENKNNYDNLKLFLDYIYKSIKIANIGIENINQTFSTIKDDIFEYINNEKKYILAKSLVSSDITNIFNILNDLEKIDELISNQIEKKNNLQNLVDSYLYSSKNICKIYLDNLIDSENLYENELKSYYKFSWNKDLAYNIIKKADLEIGGNIIDSQYSEWLYLWNQLFETSIKKYNVNKLHSKHLNVYDYNSIPKDSFKIYIPLKFFFNRNIGMSLPLISIMSQNINIIIKLNNLNNLIYTDYVNDDLKNKIKLNNISIIAKYIFLDQDERVKFANSKHEYLIEQTRLSTYLINKTDVININLDISHPTKYLIWTIQNNNFIEKYKLYNSFVSEIDYDEDNNYPILKISKGNPIKDLSIEFNGSNQIFNTGNYFNYVTAYENMLSTPQDGVNYYSWCLDPYNIQPTGSCNFSQIDSKKMTINLEDSFINSINDNDQIILKLINVGYNILQFQNGSASLLFNF